MSNSSKVSGNRGRPPDPAKREAIIQAAGELFLESELGDISMDDVAKKAKVSKITVYKHFSDKRELFQTMIEKKMEANLSESLFARLQGQDAFEELVTIARGFTNIIYSKDGVNMYRTVVAESKRGADIPHMFYAKAVEPSNRLLESHLSKLEQAGEYAFPDKRLAATIFFSIFKGDRFMRATMTVPMQEESLETEDYIRQIVRLYLKMFKLPQQQAVIESNQQRYDEQLSKLTTGVQRFKQTLMLASDNAASSALLLKLSKSNGLIEEAQKSLKLILTSQSDNITPNSSPTLKAMCKEAESEIVQQYVLDSLKDEVISSHCFRILQLMSTCCGQAINTAKSLEVDIGTLPEFQQRFAEQALDFSPE